MFDPVKVQLQELGLLVVRSEKEMHSPRQMEVILAPKSATGTGQDIIVIMAVIVFTSAPKMLEVISFT